MLEMMGNMLAASDAVDAVAETVKVANAAGSDWSVLGVLGATIGAGIIVCGAALGIGRIASSATEAIARQPEAGPRIFTSMLLASAFIEGGMLLALIICFYAIYRLTG